MPDRNMSLTQTPMPVQEPEVRSWQECMAKFGDKDPSRCPVCGARLIQREVLRPDFRGEK